MTNLIVIFHNTQENTYKIYLLYTFFQRSTQDVIILIEYATIRKKKCFRRALILRDQPPTGSSG